MHWFSDPTLTTKPVAVAGIAGIAVAAFWIGKLCSAYVMKRLWQHSPSKLTVQQTDVLATAIHAVIAVAIALAILLPLGTLPGAE